MKSISLVSKKIFNWHLSTTSRRLGVTHFSIQTHYLIWSSRMRKLITKKLNPFKNNNNTSNATCFQFLLIGICLINLSTVWLLNNNLNCEAKKKKPSRFLLFHISHVFVKSCDKYFKFFKCTINALQRSLQRLQALSSDLRSRKHSFRHRIASLNIEYVSTQSSVVIWNHRFYFWIHWPNPCPGPVTHFQRYNDLLMWPLFVCNMINHTYYYNSVFSTQYRVSIANPDWLD